MVKCNLGFEAKPRNTYFSLAAPIKRCKRLSRLTFEVRHFDQIHTRGNDGGERCRAVEILSCRERDFTRSGQYQLPKRFGPPFKYACEGSRIQNRRDLYCIEWRTAMEKHFTTDMRSFRSLDDARPCRLDGKNS